MLWQTKKTKTESSASPAKQGAESAAMEEDVPAAEAPPAKEEEEAALAPSQMEKALNEVADARSDAKDSKAASAAASPAKAQSPATKVAAAPREEQPAAAPAQKEEHPAPNSAAKKQGASEEKAEGGGGLSRGLDHRGRLAGRMVQHGAGDKLGGDCGDGKRGSQGERQWPGWGAP